MSTMTTSTTSTKNRRPQSSNNPARPQQNGNAPLTNAARNGQNLTHAQISQRAYEIFQARQGNPGDPVADWLQAERELGTGFQPQND